MSETLEQIPSLSERLTPLQRTLAESYQRVFVRGNRTDDLLIFTGLINEIAEIADDGRRPALGYVEAIKLTEQVEALQASENDLTAKLRLVQSDLALAENVIEPFRKEVFAAERQEVDLIHLISRLMFVWNKHKEDGYTLKSAVDEQRDAKEQSEGKYQALIAVMGKHFGNDPAFHLADDMAEFLNSTVLALLEEIDNRSQIEVDSLKDQLKDASGIINAYESLHNEFRPKLEPFFGRQALTQSIDDCFRNLIAGYIRANERIAQLESMMVPGENEVKAAEVVTMPCVMVEPPVAQGVAVVETPQEPKQEVPVRGGARPGAGRPKKTATVEQMDLSDLGKKFYLRGVPALCELKKHLPDVAQLAYGDGLTVTSIAKSLGLSMSDASDVLRVVDACLVIKKDEDVSQKEFMAALEEVAR